MEEDPGKTYPAPDLDDIRNNKTKERHPPLGAMGPFTDGPWPNEGEKNV